MDKRWILVLVALFATFVWGSPHPPKYRDGPPGRDHGPPGHDHGPPGHHHGPPGYDDGPPDHEHGPPGHRHGPPGHEDGPPGHEHGPPGHRHGPPGHDHGPPGHRHGPPGHDHGPPDHHHGPHRDWPDWDSGEDSNERDGPGHKHWPDFGPDSDSDHSGSWEDKDDGKWGPPGHKHPRPPPGPDPRPGRPGMPPPRPGMPPSRPIPPVGDPNRGPFPPNSNSQPSPNPPRPDQNRPRPNPNIQQPIPNQPPPNSNLPQPNPNVNPNLPRPNPNLNPNLPRPNPIPPSRPNLGPNPSAADMQNCMRNCPVTGEIIPVCGTNGITYDNPARLECARNCGVEVQLARTSQCPSNGGSSTSPLTPVMPPNFRACLTSCPVTSEYNPVCGSDGVTYNNPGRLDCANMCGGNVQLAVRSRCPDQPTQSPLTNSSPSVTPWPQQSSTRGVDVTIPQEIIDNVFTREPDTAGLIDVRRQR